MSRTIDQTNRRFVAAELNDVRYVGLEWPEFARLLVALNTLEIEAERVSLTAALGVELKMLQRARRILRSAPISPRHKDLKLAEIVSKANDIAEGHLGEYVLACRRAVVDLVGSEHPARETLRTLVVDGTDGVGGVKPERVALVLRAEAHEMMSELSAQLNLAAEIVTSTELKNGPIQDIAILFGSPEFHASWNLDWNYRQRTIAWMFNAPAAMVTVVVSWPGNAEFNISNYRPWNEIAMKVPRVSGIQRFPVLVVSINPSHPGIAPILSGDMGQSVANAVPVQLPNGLWVFFDAKIGPRANRVRSDDFDVRIEELKNPTSIERGSVLVIRTDDASRSFLDKGAENWIVEHDGKTAFQDAIRVRLGFKVAVQKLARSETGIRDLMAAGLNRDYAGYRLLKADDSFDIAPSKKENFKIIATVAGIQVGDEEWEAVTRLRTAYRQAGRQARSQLENAIHSDVMWQDKVAAAELYEINLPGVGAIMLAPVINVSDERRSVHISRLGQIVNEDGTHYV